MPFGPPIKGAPWAMRGTSALSRGAASAAASPSPGAPTSRILPLLARDPTQDKRTRQFTDQVANIVNSLVGLGQLTQTGAFAWALAPGAILTAASIATALGYTPASAAISILAGEGLTGGGLLNANRTLAVIPGQVARIRSATITGDGATTVFTVTHGLNSQDVHVQVQDSTRTIVTTPTVAAASVDTVTLTFGAAPGGGVTYRVIVMG